VLCVVCTGVCVCVCVLLYIVICYAVFTLAYHIFSISACQPADVPV
jgi:hypothetical protein